MKTNCQNNCPKTILLKRYDYSKHGGCFVTIRAVKNQKGEINGNYD